MGKYAIDETTLKDIAYELRKLKNTDDPIPAKDFGMELNAIGARLRGFLEGNEMDVVIPYGTTRLGDCLFSYQTNIKSIHLPSTLTSIGGNVFERGRGFKSIVIPDSVTDMGNYVFYGHYDIENVVIGDGVPMIGNQCFYDCASLKSVTVGSGLTEVSHYAFQYCRNCLTYDFSRCATVPNLVNSNAFDGINANAKIIVPGRLYFRWIAATNWATYSSNITYKDSEMPFTIFGTNNVYTATKGMTWREWVNTVGHTYGYTLSGDGDTAGVILPQSISGGGELWVTDMDSGTYEPVQANQTIKCTHYTGW